jgi:hypothetical protein
MWKEIMVAYFEILSRNSLGLFRRANKTLIGGLSGRHSLTGQHKYEIPRESGPERPPERVLLLFSIMSHQHFL